MLELLTFYHSVSIEGLKFVSTTSESWDDSWTTDLTIDTEVEFGPVLGERTTDKKLLQFYTETPLSGTNNVQWDTGLNKAKAVFQGARFEERSVRPSLYSYGRIRLLPLEQVQSAAGYGKLSKWDVREVSKITLVLDIEFTNEKP